MDDVVLDASYRGIPLGASVRRSEIGRYGWKVARGDLPLPVTTLDGSALEHNLTTFATMCTERGVALAPHIKTSMSPQLLARQLALGAWGVTVATATQAQLVHAWGARRIIIANEIVEPDAIRWIARLQAMDPGTTVLFLVDSEHGIDVIEQIPTDELGGRPLQALIEIGMSGGRTGARSIEQARDLAARITEGNNATVVGAELYEGTTTTSAEQDAIADLDRRIGQATGIIGALHDDGALGERPIVTAGGSSYFDLVLRHLDPAAHPDWEIVLRSGCYVSHDSGLYHRTSPLDGRASDAPRLRTAIHVWARILSTPEPTLVVLGAGKRDLPYDADLPVVIEAASPAGVPRAADGVIVQRLMDQHAIAAAPEGHDLQPGDIVRLGVSHPCGAFDRVRWIPVIDASTTVVDAVTTHF